MRIEYKASSDRRKMVQLAIYRRCKVCIVFYLVNLAFFSLVIWALNENMRYITSFSIILSILCAFSIILIVAGCVVYGRTFKHGTMAWMAFIVYTILICCYVYPLVFTCNYMDWIEYIYMYALIPMLILTVYYVMHANRFVVKNFSKLYFNIHNKIFFNQQKYEESGEDSPYIHWNICMALMAITVLIGLYSKSFYYNHGFALGVGLCSLGFAFVFYPFFVGAAYMLFVVHPRVEKKFNQPLLSDQWGLIEQNPDLAEKFWGPNPVKRPIQYEEVFPKKQKN